jgi:enoyl-CoA hydratase/carnithine racemase
LLLGESFDSEKAQEAGIVNSIYPASELMGKAAMIADRLAAQPQQAVAITKHLMKVSESEEHDALLAMSLEALHLAESAATSLAVERVAAHLTEQTDLWPLEGRSARCGSSLDVEYN